MPKKKVKSMAVYLCATCHNWFGLTLFDLNKGLCLACAGKGKKHPENKDLDDYYDPRPHILK